MNRSMIYFVLFLFPLIVLGDPPQPLLINKSNLTESISVRLMSPSNIRKGIIETDYKSHNWQAFYGEQKLTERQFLELCGQFELAYESQKLHESDGSMSTIGAVLMIAGAAATVYGAFYYEKEHEVARAGSVSISVKEKDPKNGFTYGGIGGGLLGLLLIISDSHTDSNLIDFGTARAIVNKHNTESKLSIPAQK